jgi:hypothetical protein
MRFLQLSRTIGALALTALTASACGGAGFDPPEKIKSLRILAVQKDKPYPKPGDEVNLKLLYWDGRPNAATRPQAKPAFFPFPCTNPLGDIYYNCFKDFAALGPLLEAGVLPSIGSSEVDASVGAFPMDASPIDGSAIDEAGSPDASETEGGAPQPGVLPYEVDHTKTFSFKVPLMDGRQMPIIHEGQQPGHPYGLVYIFFWACAGQVKFQQSSVPNGFPLVCVDGDKTLGPDDFVPGYASLYVYDDDKHANANPVIDDLLFASESVKDSPALEDTDAGKGPRHVPHCAPGATCETYDIKVGMDEFKNDEIDYDSVDTGSPLHEQMWVAYYATGGSFDHPLRLVRDATAGWNPDMGSKFTAPAEPGPVRLWAVAHDNRGGVAWIEAKIIVD